MNDAQSLLDELKRSLFTLSAADRVQVLAELTFLAGGHKPVRRAA